MRKTTAVALAALTALSLTAGPLSAQSQSWRADQAPDDRWYDRDDFERRGRTDIECPLTQVRREITTPLPEGWWNTPSVDYLTGTEIQTIGGRRTLVCKYGQSGQIMRLEPRRRDCVARRGGFDCRRERPGFPGGPGWPGNPGPFPPSQGGVFNQGELELRQTYQVDFDQGRVGGAGADLWFHALTPLDLYLEPVNGARLGWLGSSAGRQDCRDVTLSTDRISLGRLNIGTTLCYRTNEGRFGQFRVTGFSQQGGSRAIRLEYSTWGGNGRY
ncbi:MAG: hypothetical protein K1X35_02840 [Caulobacteraceae bacterium]|nr:hypothetical protein [Caulobacteraceae bacterium]